MANCFFAPLLLGEQFKMVTHFSLPSHQPIYTNIHPARSSWSNNRGINGCARFQCVWHLTGFRHASSGNLVNSFHHLYFCLSSRGSLLVRGQNWQELRLCWRWTLRSLWWLHRAFDKGLINFVNFAMDWNFYSSPFLHFTFCQSFLLLWTPFKIHIHQVLILTGVGQIRYLNRALMRFDSKVSLFSRTWWSPCSDFS
jgi:hypothetical protein